MGKRGPKPSPTNVVRMRGNPGKRAVNRHEPKPKIGTTCPTWLSPYAKTEWRRIYAEAERLKLVTVLDRAVLAAYCEAYSQFRMATEVMKQLAEEIAGVPDQALDSEGTVPVNGSSEDLANKMTGGLVITTKKGNLIQHPAVGIKKQAALDMLKFAGELGFTPSARSRIHINTTPEQGDLFSDLTKTVKAKTG